MTKKSVFDAFSKNHEKNYEFWIIFLKKKGRTNWIEAFNFFRNTEYGLQGGHIYRKNDQKISFWPGPNRKMLP